MNFRKPLAFTLILGLGALGGCSEPSDKPVSFQKDIMPILKSSCAECHTPPKGEGYQKTGLAVGTYEELMKQRKWDRSLFPARASTAKSKSLDRRASRRGPLDSDAAW